MLPGGRLLLEERFQLKFHREQKEGPSTGSKSTNPENSVPRSAAKPAGLEGNFDFQIAWAPEETPDSAGPSLVTVLKERLGLKLQSAKGPIETLVIDRIARPSAN